MSGLFHFAFALGIAEGAESDCEGKNLLNMQERLKSHPSSWYQSHVDNYKWFILQADQPCK